MLEPSIEQIILLSEKLETSIDYLLGTVDYDAKNRPTPEEHDAFTDEEREKFRDDLFKQAELGNLKIAYQLATENEEARKAFGMTEEEAKTGFDDAIKGYIREALEEMRKEEEKD